MRVGTGLGTGAGADTAKDQYDHIDDSERPGTVSIDREDDIDNYEM